MAQNPNGMSLLDPGQIIKRVYDEVNDSLRIEGSITINEEAIGTPGQPAPAEVKMAGGVDGNGDAQALHTDTSGDLQVDVLSSALPAGAATEATLSSLNGKVVHVDTGNVTVISSVLPTGAATEATQLNVETAVNDVEAAVNTLAAKSAAALVPEAFDEQVIAYVGATQDIQTVTYKLASATVATITLSYDGSNRLTGIVKS